MLFVLELDRTLILSFAARSASIKNMVIFIISAPHFPSPFSALNMQSVPIYRGGLGRGGPFKDSLGRFLRTPTYVRK